MGVILPPRVACKMSPFMFSAALVAALAESGVEGAAAEAPLSSVQNPDGMAILYVAAPQ